MDTVKVHQFIGSEADPSQRTCFMAKKSKIQINLADYDIVFVVLSKLMAANPKMTLREIECGLLDEHAQGDDINHELTLKKVKWKHFLWGHLKPKERLIGDDLQTVGGQLICVAETLDPLQQFIETFGEKALAGDFVFNKLGKATVKKTPVKKVTSKKPVAKKPPTKKAVAKKTPAKKAPAKKAPVKKTAAKKTAAKKTSKKKK